MYFIFLLEFIDLLDIKEIFLTLIGEIQETQLFNTSNPMNSTSIMNDNLTTILLHDILKTALNISGNNMSQPIMVGNDTQEDEQG